MGVMSTYCQICGLPVQHDHYVPIEGMFYIWRGDGRDEHGPAVVFGPEHSWLRRAVGVRLEEEQPIDSALEGVVHDGIIEGDEDEDWVMEGVFSRAALHGACWALAGRPSSFEALEHLEPPEAEEPYRQQLFDFESFVADGHGWMLVDPDDDSPDGRRSRERIVTLLQAQPTQ
jgi:hypothetical protein